MSDLPAKLPPVPIKLDAPVLDQEAIDAYKREGFIEMPADRVADLAKIGQHTHQTGTIRIQRGKAMVSQFRVEASMRALQAEIDRLQALPPNTKGRLKELLACTQQLGYLASKLTASQELMVLMEGGSAQITADGIADNVVQSFRPGSKVTPAILAKEVHIHPPPTDDPKPNPR